MRRLLLVAAVLLSTLVGAGAAGAESPIQPSNQPTPIPGATNGALPASDLINVAPHCEAARDAGPSLGLLLATAREEGVALGTDECYRSLAGQQQEQQTWTAAGNDACAAPVATSPSGGQTGTSMHGWGKASDFSDAGGSVMFGSAAYRFLGANAGRFGWNHPGWAQPGGSACPEAWHWEWVGDGGTMGATPIEADVAALMPTRDGRGYSTVTGLGAVVDHGDAVGAGTVPSAPWLITAAARTPGGGGYWLAGEDGSVFADGDAHTAGSMAGTPLNAPVVGMAATPDGGGYWLVAADGGIFSFGDAHFWGSTGALRLNRPIVGIAATPDGRGYWLVASDGGIFSFGDAHFRGSTGAVPLNAPVVGMAATTDGDGYFLVGADGGIFTFGDARYAGSAGDRALAEPAVAVARTPDGGGYWIATADGSVLAFGDAAS